MEYLGLDSTVVKILEDHLYHSAAMIDREESSNIEDWLIRKGNPLGSMVNANKTFCAYWSDENFWLAKLVPSVGTIYCKVSHKL